MDSVIMIALAVAAIMIEVLVFVMLWDIAHLLAIVFIIFQAFAILFIMGAKNESEN